MGWMNDLVRRARMRNCQEGLVQTVRTEATELDARDDVERWQDYGFSAQPVDGQGLKIEVGGHTIVLRLDRLAERPTLAPYEVSVWHKEGHRVTLKAGRLVQVDCDDLVVNASSTVQINTTTMTVTASDAVHLNTPDVTASGDMTVDGTAAANTVVAVASLQIDGKELRDHPHSGVTPGPANTGPNV